MPSKVDGRITAVSITDNPGGSPALSPDILGLEILNSGMNVIVHFTCRDTNRMGMNNILALTGDYSGKGSGGKGTPVFDFNSVVLTTMFKDLNRRLIKPGHSSIFITGCAVSPFKYTEAETCVQYRKLERKTEAGASPRSPSPSSAATSTSIRNCCCSRRPKRSISRRLPPSITSTIDRRNRSMPAGCPASSSPTGCSTRSCRNGRIRPQAGNTPSSAPPVWAWSRKASANGIYLGGIHDGYDTVGQILDRMHAIEPNWQEYNEEFQEDKPNRFYLYTKPESAGEAAQEERIKMKITDNCHYMLLKTAHDLFFDKDASLAPVYKRISSSLDRNKKSWVLKRFLEDPFKKMLLSCQSCGDCGIQHVGFPCPESGCPKHTRNGPCGGSHNGDCEVNKDQLCVWARAHERMKKHGETVKLTGEFVPPRQWELKDTSSWINFHPDRDHQKSKVRMKAKAL